ncbi:disease resistance protein RPM1 isoform X3 [Jatropha curcas]|uniref:disease resistance protein RPM1 isoform X3 n=1 Tax=Jatropha curcas TaxID=180498 RepID=UPI00189534DD|nr:disease resistance protein RPM1 isoform X3 [Jatropha curcas]
MYFAEMQRRRDSLSSTALNEIDYWAIFHRGRYPLLFSKAEMARLLSAEALIPEKEGELIDNVANNVIDELIHLGPLRETYIYGDGPCIAFNESYVNLCVVEVDEVEFLAEAANLPVRAIIHQYRNNIPPDFKTLQIRSLFLDSVGFSRASMETICKLQYLLVLHLDGRLLERLPDEVGDLFHLRYLGLSSLDMDELPQTLGNLQNLQTLDIITHRKLKELPLQVFNIQQLRHINIRTGYPSTSSGIRVPSGIGTLKSLLTLGEVYAGGVIASELSSLTQLQQLSVGCVSEDNSTQLFAAITKMENLVSLSLKADEFYSLNSSVLDLESFSPPSSIKHLRLYGALVEMPAWLASMENLTVLHLRYSNLLEPPAPTLQFLPKLKILRIDRAYKVRCIGKEFCDTGGFPKLEILAFSQEDILVEWTEIGRGAFPSLRHLEFSFCPNLRFLPEGLQNISSLQVLNLCGTHIDLGRRLLSEESYKIKHISKVSFSVNRNDWFRHGVRF